MANPQLFKIMNDIELTDFSQTPYVGLLFHQQQKGTRYYRLKCVPSSFFPYFPTVYLYLDSLDTVPNWNYTHYFPINSVKNASFFDISFEALFTLYPDSSELKINAYLQSSSQADFASFEQSSECPLITIRLKGENFGPTWTCPTWLDQKYSSNAGVALLTGSDQKGVQGVSSIRFTIPQATARYGTTIDSYSVRVVGAFSHTLTPSHIENVGTDYLSLSTYHKLVGDITVTFEVTDSRGMSTVFTRTITIVPYKELILTANDTHRQGGTGSTVLLDFAGKWFGSPLTLSCTGIVAKEEGSSAIYASLTPTITISDTSFSYKAVWSGVTFNPQKTYTITASFTDTVRTVTLTLPVPVGTPVLSIRNKKIGINNPSPSYALDVIGIIGQNGHPVMGFVKEIADEDSSDSVDLNNYKDAGYYIYHVLVEDAYHFPNTTNPNRACVVEVVGSETYLIQKLYYLDNCETHVRTYSTYGWSSWKKVTLT